jgi:1-acyl-sn-glycerol-3-phosphate acyltransferase
MAKRELLYTPLLGQFMYLSKAVFVNRSCRAREGGVSLRGELWG